MAEAFVAGLHIAACKADKLEAEHKLSMQNSRLVAEQRLHHIVKGRCGSAISLISSIRELLKPHLKYDLPEDIQSLLSAPVGFLQEAIEWCCMRQALAQLESRVYVSCRCTVDVRYVLTRAAAGCEILMENERTLAIDHVALKLALEVIIANAFKYRKDDTAIRVWARYSCGFFSIDVVNVNRDRSVLLTADESKAVFRSDFKTHSCTTMSDGIGLDSVDLAVQAAGGSVFLESKEETTLVHVSLPADPHPSEKDGTVRNEPSRSSSVPVAARPGAFLALRRPEHVKSECGIEPSTECTSTKQSTLTIREAHAYSIPSRSLSHLSSSFTARINGPAPLNEIPVESDDLGNSQCFVLAEDDDSVPINILISSPERLGSRRPTVNMRPPQACSFVHTVLDQATPTDLVVLSYTMKDPAQPMTLLGNEVVAKLRREGFLGVICVFSRNLAEGDREGLSADPGIDYVIHDHASAADARKLAELLSATRATTTRTVSAEFSVADTEECFDDNSCDERFGSRNESPLPRHILKSPRASPLSPKRKDIHDDAVREEFEHLHNCSLVTSQTLVPEDIWFDASSYSSPFANLRRSSLLSISASCAQEENLRKTTHHIRPPQSAQKDVVSFLGIPTTRKSVGVGSPLARPTSVASGLHQRTDDAWPYCATSVADKHAPICSHGYSSVHMSYQSESSIDRCGHDKALCVVGLDDEHIPRMVQGLFLKHHLKANLEESCVLGKNPEEIAAFADVAMGVLNSNLTARIGVPSQADVVILDEVIAPPKVLGSVLAAQLARRGFRGVVVLLTGSSDEHICQLRKQPGVHLVFEKGIPLPCMAEEIRAFIAFRKQHP